MRSGTILVIGYGNDIRGDDAAGRCAADRVAAWALPGVEVRTLHQLTPELADPLAAADRAIFLDAHPAAQGDAVRVRRLHGDPTPPHAAHTGDPSDLLTLCRRVYGRAPEAWWVTIPAEGFAFGAPLSPRTEAGIVDALAAVRPILASADGTGAHGTPLGNRRDTRTGRTRGCRTR